MYSTLVTGSYGCGGAGLTDGEPEQGRSLEAAPSACCCPDAMAPLEQMHAVSPLGHTAAVESRSTGLTVSETANTSPPQARRATLKVFRAQSRTVCETTRRSICCSSF